MLNEHHIHNGNISVFVDRTINLPYRYKIFSYSSGFPIPHSMIGKCIRSLSGQEYIATRVIVCYQNGYVSYAGVLDQYGLVKYIELSRSQYCDHVFPAYSGLVVIGKMNEYEIINESINDSQLSPELKLTAHAMISSHIDISRRYRWESKYVNNILKHEP